MIRDLKIKILYEEEMAKIRGRGKVGDVVKIDLANGTFGYGRVLPEPLMAFYDLRSTEPLTEAEIVASPVLFLVSVMYSAIKSARWEVIANLPLEDRLRIKPKFFMQDRFSKKYSIYFEGKITPASREDCLGLERAAAWDAIHVEDRLRNHFAGVPDLNTESLKLPDA
jgi:hypothetical protein